MMLADSDEEDQGLVMVERDSPWIVSSICHLTSKSHQTRRLTDPAPWLRRLWRQLLSQVCGTLQQ